MLGIRFVKSPPTQYLIHHSSGRVRREGPGLSFFYYEPTSTLVSVPLASQDLLFVFKELTADFQEVTVQGQLTYRVADPRLLAGLLDYSVDHRGRFLSEDPEALDTRLVNAAAVQVRASLKLIDLKSALVSVEEISRDVVRGLRETELIRSLGLEIIDVSVVSLRPSPEMGRALEAEAREELNLRSDEAIHRRRNAAVEQERKIRESEMATELMVTEKRRQLREAEVAADIAVEEQRSHLIETRVANERKEAESRAYALETLLAPMRDVEWQKLAAVNGGGDARLMMAGAFSQLAENAAKIQNLNLSPDLMESLLRR